MKVTDLPYISAEMKGVRVFRWNSNHPLWLGILESQTFSYLDFSALRRSGSPKSLNREILIASIKDCDSKADSTTHFRRYAL